MIALDTNVLVYAHREDSPHHERARTAVEELAASGRRFGLPWPCVHEFLAVSTHPRIYDPPSPTALAMQAMRELCSLPSATLLSEAPDHLTRLSGLLDASDARGPKVHDARIAAICLSHGVSELWTADRDFSYFPALSTRNPLIL
ncbi:TA system VapC family ribonuclease toxin [Microbacterium halophytorum]|uniref:TA system VapC family ribonuclease toxin n=1 Tax=Microbacterium halophytorum TaxID=2067568 RepID=UPI000CFB946E|nr:TA system VapC family ribonuclease toxin [Microbacterium halophytorum]